MERIFVYSLENLSNITDNELGEDFYIKKWTPGVTNVVPPNSPIKYGYFWFLHYLRIFKNRDYCAFILYYKNNLVCSLICVPAMYRWPFMDHKDLQIKNVYTKKSFRGRGYASLLINYTIKNKGVKNRVFWYMTSEKNIPSQKLCKKFGFRYVGNYRRKRNKYLVYEGEIYQDK